MRKIASPLNRYSSELETIEEAAEIMAELNMKPQLSADEMMIGRLAHLSLVAANKSLFDRQLKEERPPLKPHFPSMERGDVAIWALNASLLVGIMGIYGWLMLWGMEMFATSMHGASVSGSTFVP